MDELNTYRITIDFTTDMAIPEIFASLSLRNFIDTAHHVDCNFKQIRTKREVIAALSEQQP